MMRAGRLLPLLLAAAAGCGNAILGIDLKLVTKACPGALADGSRDPVAGVTQLRVKLTGDNLQPVTVTTDFASGTARIPNIPVGTNRRVTVDALKGGFVRARADSGLFDASGPEDIQLTLHLRTVDAFTLTADSTASNCSQMTVARAGHAMALLPDGRVLITGGFSVNASGQIVPHSSAEIFDPRSGAFSPVAPAQFRRSGHNALQVAVGSNGSGILLLGGEGLEEGASTPGPIGTMELFSSGLWRAVQPGPTTPSREYQAAAVDVRTGYALLAGGQSGPDSRGPTVFDSASYYDPASGAVRDVGSRLTGGPVTGAQAVARHNKAPNGPAQGGIVIVGGRGSNLQPTRQISALIWRDTSNDFIPDTAFGSPDLSQLPTARANHVAVRLDDDTVLTAGGVTSYGAVGPDFATATDAVTIIDPARRYVADVGRLVQQRADACAAVLEDGQVLIAGGAWKDGSGTHAAANAEIIAPLGRDTRVRSVQGPTQGGTWSLQQARYRAACIRLRDGSVLVTGGLTLPGSGVPAALQSAEIYVPSAPVAAQ